MHDFHSHEIAEQLTLLDAELFYKIEVWLSGPAGRQLALCLEAAAGCPSGEPHTHTQEHQRLQCCLFCFHTDS